MIKALYTSFVISVISLFSVTREKAFASDTGVFRLTSGVDYSSGTYGSNDRTDITLISIIGKYDSKNTFYFVYDCNPG
jgi:hypothetical protein